MQGRLPAAPARCSANAPLQVAIPPGVEGRHAHPPGRRRRGQPVARVRHPGLTCTSRSVRIRSSSATARISHARAAAGYPGGARRRCRGAGDRRQQGQGEDIPARHPDRRISPLCAVQVGFRCQQQARGDTSRCRWRRRRTQSSRRQHELLEEFEAEAQPRQRQPGERGIFLEGEGVLRRRPGVERRTDRWFPLRGTQPTANTRAHP